MRSHAEEMSEEKTIEQETATTATATAESAPESAPAERDVAAVIRDLQAQLTALTVSMTTKEGEKKCSICKKAKSLSEYSRFAGNGRVYSICRPCTVKRRAREQRRRARVKAQKSSAEEPSSAEGDRQGEAHDAVAAAEFEIEKLDGDTDDEFEFE